MAIIEPQRTINPPTVAPTLTEADVARLTDDPQPPQRKGVAGVAKEAAYNLFSPDYRSIVTPKPLVPSKPAEGNKTDTTPIQSRYTPQMFERQTPQKKTLPAVDANDPTSGMDLITSRFTSPEQEEKYRKASLNRQRILAVGDALRHIGNIYHTVKYAPSQQFSNPVEDEYKRYKTEKGARDTANARYLTYQQAKAKQDAEQRRWEYEQGRKDKEFGWKVANEGAKTAAYVGTQKKNQELTDARIKNEGYRGEGIQADTKWKQFRAQNAPKEFELKERNVNSQIASRADASRRGWANYNLSVSREQRMRKGGSYSGVSKDRELYSSPDGSAYSFPKGTINSKNINQIYGDMVRKKLITGTHTTDGEKWDAIMNASGHSKGGHDAFIYHAKRLGYEYEGGMDPDIYESYWGKPVTKGTSKPSATTTAKPAAKPTKSTAKPAATKSSQRKGNTGNEKKHIPLKWG